MSQKYFERVILPQNEINKKNIATLFSVTSNFDINEISKFTSEYNLSYNVTDNDGKSVLHLLIGIDDLNKSENLRLHLIKYFIDIT